jgi:tRNA threonylcarbamoyladenosine biosynthesis protein TsaB
MTRILSIETSTTVCSVALHDEGKLVAFEITHVPNSAAGQLAVMIDKILKQHGAKLVAVAVSSGPGSYTGLRIGVATAKGLCYALSIPLLSVNSLELMAKQVNANSLMAPMIDARRMEVYTMLLNDKLEILQPVSASIIDSTSYSEILNYKKIFFFGNGSSKCKDVLTHPNANFIDDIFPSAEWMGGIAFDLFKKSKFENVSDFEPLYLKDFVAKKPKSLV